MLHPFDKKDGPWNPQNILFHAAENFRFEPCWLEYVLAMLLKKTVKQPWSGT